MVHKRICQRCGSIMITRVAPEHIANTVKEITGQKIVIQYLCAVCYPNKVKEFLSEDNSKDKSKGVKNWQLKRI